MGIDEGRPFEHTDAARMLSQAIRRRQEADGLDLRALGLEFGYKSGVALSHMATGRALIPIERTPEFARILGLDPRTFLISVLDQRFPGLVGRFDEVLPAAPAADPALMVQDLQRIAGCNLDDLPVDVAHILKEVVAERRPAARWATLDETPVLAMLRELRPDINTSPLTSLERTKIVEALRKVFAQDGGVE